MKFILILILTISLQAKELVIPNYSESKDFNQIILTQQKQDQIEVKNILDSKFSGDKIIDIRNLRTQVEGMNFIVFGENIDFKKLKDLSFKGKILKNVLSDIQNLLKTHYSVIGRTVIFHNEKIDWNKKLKNFVIKSPVKDLDTAKNPLIKFPKVRISWHLTGACRTLQMMFNQNHPKKTLEILDQTNSREKVTLDLNNVTLEEALRLICLLTEKQITIEAKKVIIK